MIPRPVSFVLGDGDRSGALDALTDLGYRPEPPHAVRLTRLDTFDGRFEAAGLRLVVVEADDCQLVLSGDDVVDALLSVPAVPRFAEDLPPGPFRTRVGAVTDVRALLPVVAVDATRTRLTLRDAAGKTTAAVTVLDDIEVADADAAADAPRSLLELRPVVGFPGPARRTRDALEHLDLVAVDADALTSVAARCGIDLGGFRDSPTVPLDATAPAVDGFGSVLANLAGSIDANWEGTIARVDPEFLHDLRVAVRRSRSVLSQGKAVLPPEVVSAGRTQFGSLSSLTGPARDLDVYLIEWGSYVRPLGGGAAASLEPVRQLLERRRAAAYQQLTDELRAEDAAGQRAAWRRSLDNLAAFEPQGRRAERPLGRVVRKRLISAQDTLVERGRKIRPDTPAEKVHELRKDAKKLRYLIECFGSILPDAPKKAFVKRLKAFQNNLGEHQDAEVHVAVLHDLALELHDQGVAPDTLLAMGQLAERLDQVRLAARAEFAERFADYDTPTTQRAFDDMLDGIDR